MDPNSAQDGVPAPDPLAVPEGFLVEIVPGERIHFLDWGGPSPGMTLSRGGSGCSWFMG